MNKTCMDLTIIFLTSRTCPSISTITSSCQFVAHTCDSSNWITASWAFCRKAIKLISKGRTSDTIQYTEHQKDMRNTTTASNQVPQWGHFPLWLKSYKIRYTNKNFKNQSLLALQELHSLLSGILVKLNHLRIFFSLRFLCAKYSSGRGLLS